MMRHIPNLLSMLRILMVGLFAYLFLTGRYAFALAVFVFAFFTDVLDGRLARSRGWVTDIGKILDPLADKLMTVTALLCIYLLRPTPWYLLIFVLAAFKEAVMVIGGLLFLKHDIVVYADWFGKIAGGLFAAGIALTLTDFVAGVVEPWNLVSLCCATVLAYVAMVHYGLKQLRLLRASGDAQKHE